MIDRAARAAIALLFVVAMNTSTPPQVSAAPAPEKGKPCSAVPYRQFDFWLGSWDVTEKGKVAGTNRIESILGGCALHESWHGASGLQGNSINFYDAPRGLWHQTWIDAAGNGLVLEGKFENGAMRLEGKRPGSTPGATDLHRITWTPLPDGKVRQLWETSSDSGKSWSEAFDGLYARAK
jgi:hypothetical protein